MRVTVPTIPAAILRAAAPANRTLPHEAIERLSAFLAYENLLQCFVTPHPEILSFKVLGIVVS